MNNWIEISEPHLAANFRALQSAAGPATEVLAVIKADAYGHGAELCARILTRAGARWLGVTCAAEGVRIRAALAGQPANIMVMSGFLPEDVPLIRAHALTPVLWTADHVRWLASGLSVGLQPHEPSCPENEGFSPGPQQAVHIEVDTGMGRQGVPPGPELTELLTQIKQANLQLDGIFTHFCSSEEAASQLTQLQQRRFESAVAQIRAADLQPRWLHAGNSSTIDNPAEPNGWLTNLAATVGARAMVRAGLALYGYCLPIEGAASHVAQPALRPVMTWKARVLSVRALAPGETVGYNATFTAAKPMRIALIPAGYADGLRRELSSTNQKLGGWIMLHNRRAPILGRISMNLTVVDITEIDEVNAGDEAILLGEGITADDHATLAGTISYEILCGIHPCG